ncbi:MAG: EamA family transporter RarD [Corynebacterium sp.]|uniref:EamA family transporter RarD n=1 Tax=Corynebacterium sp. TaxID=1720 RepID=UPI0026DC9D7D|nr:EamA family transporter RarD [Corynebacterium sp.]MDO5029624.1 EamA family transporter RarD [Corynebacterium sp.]
MIQAFGAYLLWAVFPLYFPLLEPAGPVEILAHRFVWTLVFMAIALSFMRAWPELKAASAKTWGTIFIAALLISVNWGVYVYLVNSGQVAEAALGYFINPLVSVLLAMIFFRESISKLQLGSVILAIVAVIVLTIGVGHPPVWALALAFSFGFYGMMKKRVSLSSAASLTAESAVITPIALAYIAWLAYTGESTFTAEGTGHTLLMMSAGIATAVPLLLFGEGAKRLPLATIGLMQYITPIIQMTLAVTILGEELSPERWIGYFIIWGAVALFICDLVVNLVRQQRRRKKLRAAGIEPAVVTDDAV